VKDRVGLGWRPEIAGAIFLNLDHIDVVELIVDNYFRASRRDLQAFETLSAQVPVVYHGVSLGLASAHMVDEKRLAQIARAFDVVKPETWSEHLAFVRAGGYEIGHLAAPPRTRATIDGTLENLARLEKYVGVKPHLENIATLIDPPGSSMTEPDWVGTILRESGSSSLLDLHNLLANAVNFGFNPKDYVTRFPLERVHTVHLSGGRWIEVPGRPRDERRLLDDHFHDVPADVFDLLEIVASRATHPLTVIIERDGEYPAFDSFLAQIADARAALARGRARLQGGRREHAVVTSPAEAYV
jgi:uncharacterized protein (UPF0276 family)